MDKATENYILAKLKRMEATIPQNGGGGSSITVDDALSTTSVNPVQNKVITNAINGKQDALTSQTAYSQKGSSTKIPQITTNELGQVTEINEIDAPSFTIDAKLDDESTNAIQNKPVAEKLETLEGSLGDKVETSSVLSTLSECMASTTSTDVASASVMKELNTEMTETDTITLSSNGLKFTKAGNTVSVVWAQNGATYSSGTLLTTLPEKFRPFAQQRFAVFNQNLYMQIETNGEVYAVNQFSNVQVRCFAHYHTSYK